MNQQTPLKKPDLFTFHSLETLQQMPVAALEALWELVPTDRQRLYRAIYDRTRRDEDAAGSDALEARMVHKLLGKYAQKGLVPIGSYWVPAPPQIREAAATDREVIRPEIEATSVRKPSPVILGTGVLCVLVFAFLFMRGLGGGGRKTDVTRTVTTTPTLTVTPARTSTPTPLALEAQDSIIRGGDTSSTLLYPVNLRVILGEETQPRLFVVQRRVIQTTEWNYDDNPDVASYLNGLTIRPVLGIPWSDANAALFERLTAGSVFVLQMNTGAALRFAFASRQSVNRGDTRLFRQAAPGLVLVLIGERDPQSKESTPDRTLILANYGPEQELSSGAISGIQLPTAVMPTPTLAPTPVQRIDVQVIAVESMAGQVQIRLRIYNGRYTQATLDSHSIWLAYGYAEHPIGPQMAAEMQPFGIEPGQAVDLTLHFAWHNEPFATLSILRDYQFAITFKEMP